MIKIHLSRLMGEHRLKIADVARELDVHRNTINLMYHEKAQKVDLDVLNKLCKLFNCKISDILEFQEDEQESG